MICFPDDYIYIRTIVGTVHHCLTFFFNGLTSNVFRFIDDNIKTILNNSGGSPKLIWSWSDFPIPRFAQIQMGLVSLVFIELIYGNFINQARYIPINSNESIRYTYGLVIMVVLLVSFTIAFSRSGNRLKNLSSLFFTLGFFQSFLSDKIPGVLLKNIFTNLSTSSLVSSIAGSKDELDISAIMFGKNKEKQYKLIILPVHIFFLSVGRLLQVSLFIILNLISLLLFILFILFCFGFIFNYINAWEFGDGSISFFEIIKSLPRRSLSISLETLHSKLIIKTPAEWAFTKSYTVSELNWAEEVPKFAEGPLSREDLKSDLITKEVPAGAKTYFSVFMTIGITFFVIKGLAENYSGVAA